MIISFRHGFIFVKGSKVAGTSIEMALSLICGPEDVIAPILARDEADRLRMGGRCQNYGPDPAAEEAYRAAIAAWDAQGGAAAGLPFTANPGPALFTNHMSLRDALLRCRRDIRFFNVFGVERSPYSKVISWANMHASFASYAGGGEMRAAPAAIARAVDAGLADGKILRVRNIDRYRGLDGTIAATLLRYADLPGALASHLAGIGAPPPPPLPHAKRGLMADTLDVRSILRPDQIAAVNHLFAEEFTAFGYPVLAA
jgi:hypothetical protein